MPVCVCACACTHAHTREEQVREVRPSWASWHNYPFNVFSSPLLPALALDLPLFPHLPSGSCIGSSLQGPSPVGVLQNLHLLPKLQVLRWTRLHPPEAREREKKKLSFLSGEQTLSQELGWRQVGFREKRQGSSYSREVRERTWPTWVGEKGEEIKGKREREMGNQCLSNGKWIGMVQNINFF